jgi:hypothetical protein
MNTQLLLLRQCLLLHLLSLLQSTSIGRKSRATVSARGRRQRGSDDSEGPEWSCLALPRSRTKCARVSEGERARSARCNACLTDSVRLLVHLGSLGGLRGWKLAINDH